MYHLIIDTCVWIDLCKKFPELRQKILDLVERKKVRLILPSVVIEEWKRQKPKLLDERGESVRGMLKNAKSLSEYLDPETADKLKTILDVFQEEKDKVEDAASKGIKQIESLFDHSTTIILGITDTAKLQAADFALAKKAPFKNKNSMADALIIFSATEHIAKEGLANCIFVSSNTQDFGSASTPTEIHDDLSELFGRHGVKYFTNMGLALNEVEANLVNEENVQEIEVTVRFDTLREALQSIRAYDRQFTEVLTASTQISAMQELANAAGRQIVQGLNAAGQISAMHELANAAGHKIMESLNAAGKFSVMQELSSEAQRQLMESVTAAGKFSVMQELASEAQRQLMESVTAAGKFPAMQELANEAHRQIADSLKAAVDFSAMNEVFRAIRNPDLQLMDAVNNSLETIATSTGHNDKVTPPGITEGNEPKVEWQHK